MNNGIFLIFITLYDIIHLIIIGLMMAKGKITFINPRDFCKFINNTPYPPLGLGYLAAVLIRKGYKVNLIDGQILSKEEYEKRILEDENEVLGISATIKQMKEAKRVASIVKSRNPNVTIIIGGAGPNSLPPKSILKSGVIDIIVRGEAEETLPLLIDALNSHSPLEKVPNIIYLDNGRIIKTKTTPPPLNLDSIPFPDREILLQQRYLSRWKKRTGITSLPIMSSRGCPFSCIFCDKTISGRLVRFRSPKNVVDEMEFLAKKYHPLDDIFFYDDLFTVNRKRVLAICGEIFKRGLKASWSAQGRVDTIDLEMLKTMRKAGCDEIYFGIESGSDRILKYLMKRFTRKQIINAFNLCHKAGIRPGAYIIVGVPGETKDDIEATKSLIKKIRPYLINFSYLTPFPNTILYKKTKHLLKTKDFTQWDEMTKSPYKPECFDIDPKEAHDQIYEVFKELISKGMEYSNLQFICDQ